MVAGVGAGEEGAWCCWSHRHVRTRRWDLTTPMTEAGEPPGNPEMSRGGQGQGLGFLC